jgi:hypothetical protein
VQDVHSADARGSGTGVDGLTAKWDACFPSISQSWRSRWEQVITFFRLPAGDPEGHLHDQRDRVDQCVDPEGHKQARGVSNGGFGAEGALRADHASVCAPAPAGEGLVRCTEPLRDGLRWARGAMTRSSRLHKRIDTPQSFIPVFHAMSAFLRCSLLASALDASHRAVENFN